MLQYAADDDDAPAPADDERITLAQEADRIIEEDRADRQAARRALPLTP